MCYIAFKDIKAGFPAEHCTSETINAIQLSLVLMLFLIGAHSKHIENNNRQRQSLLSRLRVTIGLSLYSQDNCAFKMLTPFIRWCKCHFERTYRTLITLDLICQLSYTTHLYSNLDGTAGI
uniref:Uncharacterized protein n=1 Tax=Mola mola TaxID=94237 RepID=A0A3Q4AF33_MOLML